MTKISEPSLTNMTNRSHNVGTRVLLEAMAQDPLALSVSRRFPREAISVRRARDFAVDALAVWGCDGDVAERVRLVVSELVTNSYRHAPSAAGQPDDLLVGLVCVPGIALVVYAADRSSTGIPVPRIAGPGAEGGRGLSIVTSESDGWCAWPPADGAGKSVAAHFLLHAA